jgi:hypothetical protein
MKILSQYFDKATIPSSESIYDCTISSYVLWLLISHTIGNRNKIISNATFSVSVSV